MRHAIPLRANGRDLSLSMDRVEQPHGAFAAPDAECMLSRLPAIPRGVQTRLGRYGISIPAALQECRDHSDGSRIPLPAARKTGGARTVAVFGARASPFRARRAPGRPPDMAAKHSSLRGGTATMPPAGFRARRFGNIASRAVRRSSRLHGLPSVERCAPGPGLACNQSEPAADFRRLCDLTAQPRPDAVPCLCGLPCALAGHGSGRSPPRSAGRGASPHRQRPAPQPLAPADLPVARAPRHSPPPAVPARVDGPRLRACAPGSGPARPRFRPRVQPPARPVIRGIRLTFGSKVC